MSRTLLYAFGLMALCVAIHALGLALACAPAAPTSSGVDTPPFASGKNAYVPA